MLVVWAANLVGQARRSVDEIYRSISQKRAREVTTGKIGVLTLGEKFTDPIHLDPERENVMFRAVEGVPIDGVLLLNGKDELPFSLNLGRTNSRIPPDVFSIAFRAVNGKPRLAFYIYRGDSPPEGWYDRALQAASVSSR
jgi:hypothetical protein